MARSRGKPPEEMVAELIVEDGTRIQVVYFGMSEANVAREVTLPWMSFGSDAAALAPEGVFLKSSTHPRAYGNFARLLGKYVREEKRVPLAEAVRRLSALPASNLGIADRGSLKPVISPISRYLTLARLLTMQHLQSRSNMRSAWSMCWSTAFPCCVTAYIPGDAGPVR